MGDEAAGDRECLLLGTRQGTARLGSTRGKGSGSPPVLAPPPSPASGGQLCISLVPPLALGSVGVLSLVFLRVEGKVGWDLEGQLAGQGRASEVGEYQREGEWQSPCTCPSSLPILWGKLCLWGLDWARLADH